jgi:molybdopterin synthase sulfur carrier subunit
MVITVNLYAMLRRTTGVSSVTIETDGPIVLRQLIDLACAKTTPQLRDDLLDGNTIKKGTLLLVDGRNALFLDGLETLVQAGQEIAFFPPGGGG